MKNSFVGLVVISELFNIKTTQTLGINREEKMVGFSKIIAPINHCYRLPEK